MEFKEHLKKYLSDNEIELLMESLLLKDKHSLLLNTLKVSNNDFENSYPNLVKHPLVDNGYLFDKDENEFGKMYMHDAGCYYIQEPSAMIVASLLHPTEDDIVLDMCAAPGGKTIQSALLMNNKGLLISNDLSYARAKILSSNVERFGLVNTIVTSMDLHRLPSSFNSCFTKIILDAPCSGSGMFRKDSKFEDDWTYEKVLKCAEIQKELIDLAYNLLAPGGTLVYSTCSFSYEEDEEVVQYLLDNYKDMKVLDIKKSEFFYKSNSNIGIHLFPSHFNGEGHYICLLQKEGELINKRNLPINKKNSNIKPYLNEWKKYQLENYYHLLNNDSLYATTYNLDISQLTVLRSGLKVLEINKNISTPDYALSHYLDSSSSIKLNEDQLKLYIHGDTFSINDNTPNGFYPVSFNNINLGFVKVVNGTIKNHYPKGLRH